MIKESWILFFKKNTPKRFRFFLRGLRRGTLYFFQSLIGLKFRKNYYCPVNLKAYRTFIKDGKLLVSLDLGARERHRFIWHYLSSETKILQDGGDLLHISPEFCFYQKLKNNKNINYHPVDKFEPGYDYLSLTKDFDLLGEPSAAEKYDFIICNHVLEHIKEDRLAISHLYKLLKKGGEAILSVPILKNNLPTYEDDSIVSPQERKKHFGQWDHVRYYGVDIRNRFEQAGFQVKTVNSTDYFTEEERIRFGVHEECYLFHLSK